MARKSRKQQGETFDRQELLDLVKKYDGSRDDDARRGVQEYAQARGASRTRAYERFKALQRSIELNQDKAYGVNALSELSARVDRLSAELEVEKTRVRDRHVDRCPIKIKCKWPIRPPPRKSDLTEEMQLQSSLDTVSGLVYGLGNHARSCRYAACETCAAERKKRTLCQLTVGR